jgi:hypothetical protein
MSIAQIASENIKSFHNEGNTIVDESDDHSISINLTNEVTQQSIVLEMPCKSTISELKSMIQDSDGMPTISC